MWQFNVIFVKHLAQSLCWEWPSQESNFKDVYFEDGIKKNK